METSEKCNPLVSYPALCAYEEVMTFDTYNATDNQRNDSEVSTPSDENLLSGFGPTKLTRGQFLANASARNAIRSEVIALIKPMADGIAALKIVDGNHIEFRKMPRIGTTLVVKLKAGPKFKARLRLRGGQESLSALSYSSSPTVGRDMLKVAIITYVNYPSYVCATVDISQAFILMYKSFDKI